MKPVALLFFTAALLCGGCAVENFDPASVRPTSSPALPDMTAKPDKIQRAAIMSGEQPDWHRSSPPTIPLKK